jgi:FixJ family two-component response regulator
MSGKELVEQLGSQRPEMRVLYMSGYADATLQRRVLAGQAAFLPKPFTAEQLIQKVQAVLSGPHVDPGQQRAAQAFDK